MKALLFLQKNKYQIGFFIMAGLCIYFLLQGVKKDHSFELFKQEIKYQEAARQQIIKERQPLEAKIQEQIKTIIELKVKDSLVALQANAVENRIKEISKPQYVKEKIKAVENLNGNDLLNYITNLPEPNDY